MDLKTHFKTSIPAAILTSILWFIAQTFIITVVLVKTNNEAISYSIGYILTLILMIIKYHKNLINDAKNLKNDLKGKLKNIIYVYIGAILLMYATNIILYLTLNNIASNEDAVRDLLFSSPILMFFSLGIAGPIIEEIQFRYSYRNVTNKKLAFIIYTGIFALIHVVGDLSFPSCLYLISYTFLSIAIGYPFYKTNNIYASIGAHMFNNIASTLIVLMAGV